MNWDQICKRIGQAHGVSAEEIRREMEAALDAAWNRTDKTERMADLQAEIPSRKEAPSPEELVTFLRDCILDLQK